MVNVSFQWSAAWLVFFAVGITATTYEAAETDVEQGNAFLDEILPQWIKFCKWNGEECGKLSWTLKRDGSPPQHHEGFASKNHFLVSNWNNESTEIAHTILNPEYYAGIVVNAEAGTTDIQFLHEKGDSSWDAQRMDANRLPPIWSTSKYPAHFFPELIRDGHLQLTTYEHASDGLHRLTFERKDDLRYGDLVLEFRDDIPNMPVSSINNFAGTSNLQKFTNSKFEKVGEFYIPTVVKCVSGSEKARTEMDLAIEWDQSESLDESRCHLEYYEIAQPEFEIADTKRNGSNAIAIAIAAIAGVTVAVLLWRNYA